jgi:hypothetical protein
VVGENAVGVQVVEGEPRDRVRRGVGEGDGVVDLLEHLGLERVGRRSRRGCRGG